MAYFRDTIEQMAGYTPGFQPKEADVVKLNTNENPYPASPDVLQAIQNLTAENLRRYPDPMAGTFRKAAAKVLAVQPENIICTNGGDDLLNICVRACCERGRPLAYAQPTYSLYPVLAQLHGCEVIEIQRDANGSLEQLAEVNAALTIVCNPNAPTCQLLPIDALATLASALSGVLLIDEAYVDFAEDNGIRLVNEFDNVVLLRSMSKGYSLAGMRFGFGITGKRLMEGLMKVKDSYPVDAAAIAAATAAIQDQACFKANVEKIKTERARLTDQLSALAFEVPNSQTNFILAHCVKKEAKEVYESLVQRNIFVRYFALPELEDKLRITIGTPQQNNQLLDALKEIIG
ncbi:MAG: histidinol-phosphate transaminase [Phycisphaerae bacterium]|nr:histidinol-phosphate transaminase [Phycisphaerae bacterium]